MVLKDLQRVTRQDLADGGGLRAVGEVAVVALDKDVAVAETFNKRLAADVEQEYAFVDMAAGLLDGGVATDDREEAESETVGLVGGVAKAVDDEARVGSMEHLTHVTVELIAMEFFSSTYETGCASTDGLLDDLGA